MKEKRTKLAHDLGVWKEAGLIRRDPSAFSSYGHAGARPFSDTTNSSSLLLPSSFSLSELRRPYVHKVSCMILSPLNYTVKVFVMSYNIRIHGVGHYTTGRRGGEGGGLGKVWQVDGTNTDVMLLSRGTDSGALAKNS